MIVQPTGECFCVCGTTVSPPAYWGKEAGLRPYAEFRARTRS
jgi:hypothetical protein